METSVVENSYPLSFRKNDLVLLGQHLRHRHSVDLVGMKRVGISNFLRFFLNKKGIDSTYIGDDKKHVFILVDLHDLVERELFPFWTLTLKRIADVIQTLPIAIEKKQRVEAQFLSSIQSQELFLLIDSTRSALVTLVEEGYCPTLFFLRFDRINDVVTSTFLDNLQGMKDATDQQVSYVFTSYRSLEELLSPVTAKATLKIFSYPMYLQPAGEKDLKTIYQQYKKRYRLELTSQTEQSLMTLVGGNVQYLQLAVVILQEQNVMKDLTQDELLTLFCKDERVLLYAEELWESITDEEKQIVKKIQEGKQLSEEEKKKGAYLFLTGMIIEQKQECEIFSQLFAKGVSEQGQKLQENGEEIHMSKKEQLLIDLLTMHKEEICEREMIIEHVWPEYQAFGVSDWAIDRLVARVRGKLRKQHSKLEIKTIRTRGYKLTETK